MQGPSPERASRLFLWFQASGRHPTRLKVVLLIIKSGLASQAGGRPGAIGLGLPGSFDLEDAQALGFGLDKRVLDDLVDAAAARALLEGVA